METDEEIPQVKNGFVPFSNPLHANACYAFLAIEWWENS